MSNELSTALPIRRLLIGACGSVGIVHLPEILVHLMAVLPELEISVLMTERASEFIPASTLALVTRRPVLVGVQRDPGGMVAHVELPAWADLFLVMPATANVLGKAAQGIADDVLTTSLLAAVCPVVFVPSMNARMWEKPAVQRNVRQLREDGAWVLEPSQGVQASTGAISTGSLPPLRTLLVELAAILQNSQRPNE